MLFLGSKVKFSSISYRFNMKFISNNFVYVLNRTNFLFTQLFSYTDILDIYIHILKCNPYKLAII